MVVIIVGVCIENDRDGITENCSFPVLVENILRRILLKQADRCIRCIRRRERGGAHRNHRVVGRSPTGKFALLFYICSYVEMPTHRKAAA